jgi:hypothetical protein
VGIARTGDHYCVNIIGGDQGKWIDECSGANVLSQGTRAVGDQVTDRSNLNSSYFARQQPSVLGTDRTCPNETDRQLSRSHALPSLVLDLEMADLSFSTATQPSRGQKYSVLE